MKYQQTQELKNDWNNAKTIDWKCSKCTDVIIKYVDKAIEHAKSHGFKVSCSVCDALFMNKKKLRQHFSKHHEINK
jgi:uncharacterized C2H2 Zn-finger protein